MASEVTGQGEQADVAGAAALLRPHRRLRFSSRGAMYRLTETLWIGGATYALPYGVDSVLNVAQDLRGMFGWPDIEYWQVGLIDGPGNAVAAYHSAVLALAAMQKRGTTMLMCHGGSRSMAVALMYLNLISERGWNEWLEMLQERVDAELPVVNNVHKEVFHKKINWKFLAEVAR